MKEKKTGNVRGRGLNKDVCGASREVVVNAGMGDGGQSGTSLQCRARQSGSALTVHR